MVGRGATEGPRGQMEGGLMQRSGGWLGSKAKKGWAGRWGPGIQNWHGGQQTASSGPRASDMR